MPCPAPPSAPACCNYWKRNDVDNKLLDILVCPLCKGPLLYKKPQAELICKPCRLAYPIKDDIPVMLEEEARKLPPEEEVS